MEIKKYSKADESLLFDLLVDEGDEWSDYHGVSNLENARVKSASKATKA